MPDDVSIGELWRRQVAHEEQHRALDDRVTELARNVVPVGALTQAVQTQEREIGRLEREHQDDIQTLRREFAERLAQLRTDVIDPMARRIGELEGRPQMTFGRWIGVLTVVAAFLAVVVAAWSASGGAK